MTSLNGTHGTGGSGGNSSAPDQRVRALSAALERATRRIAALEAHGRQQDTLLRQLAADVQLLAATTAAPGDDGPEAEPNGPAAVRSWLAAADPEQAQLDLRALVQWAGAVYARWPDGTLPSCWLWHPAVVEELWWLSQAHVAAFEGRGACWRDVADWHDRHRPGVVRRIRPVLQTCELGRHGIDGDRRDLRPRVPLTAATDAIATAWTTQRDTPDPTAQELADAEQHDRTQHRTHR